jgi:hypothetical protein
MRVNFPDDLTEPNSEAAAYAAMDSVNAFYVQVSRHHVADDDGYAAVDLAPNESVTAPPCRLLC